MDKKTITCIECPMGCTIEASIDDNGKIEVSGNTCPRGKMYAENEITCPRRVITTTVRAKTGEMISVKTDKPVKKEQMFMVMEKINKISPTLPIKIGDVLMKNIVEEINLVATSNCF